MDSFTFSRQVAEMTQTEVLIEGYRRDWNRAEEKRIEALIEQKESDLVIIRAALEVFKRDAPPPTPAGKPREEE